MSCLSCKRDLDFFGTPVFHKATAGHRIKWCWRGNRFFLLVGFVLLACAGAALIAVGAAMAAKPVGATVGSDYYIRLAAYESAAVPALTRATVGGFALSNASVAWQLVGRNGTDARSYTRFALVGTVPRPPNQADVVVDLTITDGATTTPRSRTSGRRVC